MQYLVRHGVINYTGPGGKPMKAFRGMTVDIADEADVNRLVKYNAIVKPDVELEKPGEMLALPQSATDEQILSWVASATPTEVKALVEERPILADRIRAAAEDVQERLKKQHELLSGVVKAADDGARVAADQEAERKAAKEAEAERKAKEAEENGGQPPVPGAVPLANSDDSQATEDVDEVIKGNVGEISKYLAAHPEQAQAVLDAENRRVDAQRAAGKDEQPRAGLVRAVQAAAGHAGQ